MITQNSFCVTVAFTADCILVTVLRVSVALTARAICSIQWYTVISQEAAVTLFTFIWRKQDYKIMICEWLTNGLTISVKSFQKGTYGFSNVVQTHHRQLTGWKGMSTWGLLHNKTHAWNKTECKQQSRKPDHIWKVISIVAFSHILKKMKPGKSTF